MLFVVPCDLCLLHSARCGVCWLMLFVVLLFVVSCLLFIACCSLFVARCSSFVGCVLFDVCRLLFVV